MKDKVEIKWYPIKDAPKDNTCVVLWHKNGFRISPCAYKCSLNPPTEEGHHWTLDWHDDDFTHYAPILAPPGE